MLGRFVVEMVDLVVGKSRSVSAGLSVAVATATDVAAFANRSLEETVVTEDLLSPSSHPSQDFGIGFDFSLLRLGGGEAGFD